MPPKKEKVKQGKAYFSGKIDGLKENLEIRDLVHKALINANLRILEKFEKEKQDSSDILEYLNYTYQDKQTLCEQKNALIIRLKKDLAYGAAVFEGEAKNLQKAFAPEIDSIKGQILKSEMKMAAMDKHRIQRQEMIDKIEETEEEIAKQEDVFSKILYQMERKAILLNAQLKSAVGVRAEKLLKGFRKVADVHLSNMMKQATRETVQVSKELSEISDSAAKNFQDNQIMYQKLLMLRRQNNIFTDFQNGMDKVINEQREKISDLCRLCRNQKKELSTYTASAETFRQQLTIYLFTRNDIKKAKEDIKNVLRDRKALSMSLKYIQYHMQSLEDYNSNVMYLVIRATKALPFTLARMKPGEDEVMYRRRREVLILNLLNLMDHAAESEDKRKIYNIDSPASVDNWDCAQLPIHYMRGDLGLMHRPTSPGPWRDVVTMKDDKNLQCTKFMYYFPPEPIPHFAESTTQTGRGLLEDRFKFAEAPRFKALRRSHPGRAKELRGQPGVCKPYTSAKARLKDKDKPSEQRFKWKVDGVGLNKK